MRIPKCFIRKSAFAVLAVVALCVATAILGTQSLYAGSNTSNARAVGKLDPALSSLTAATLPPGKTVSAIIQFTDNVLKSDSKQVKNQKKLSRNQITVAAGGKVDLDFDNLPVQVSRLGFNALQTLGKHSEVKHISVNHPV